MSNLPRHVQVEVRVAGAGEVWATCQRCGRESRIPTGDARWFVNVIEPFCQDHAVYRRQKDIAATAEKTA